MKILWETLHTRFQETACKLLNVYSVNFSHLLVASRILLETGRTSHSSFILTFSHIYFSVLWTRLMSCCAMNEEARGFCCYVLLAIAACQVLCALSATRKRA